jgi:PAS domain S-box-containing protein
MSGKKGDTIRKKILERSEFALDCAPMEIYFFDRKGVILHANQYALMAWGISGGVPDGLTVFDIEPGLEQERLDRIWNSLGKEGDSREESFHTSRAGFFYPVEKTLSLIKVGRQLVCCAFTRDITERTLQQNELILARDKAEESDRLKSEFLANLSHEIRTPMNAIIGLTYLIKTGIKTGHYPAEKMEHFISLVQENGSHLLELIDDIIDFSRIEANQLSLQPAWMNLRPVLDEICHSFSVTLPEPVKLILDWKLPDPDPVVWLDRTRFRQILNNLLSNARKHTENGSITILCTEETKGSYRFSIIDTGVGIPSGKREEIFRRFHKLSAIMPGAGLGLNICQGLILLMGGTLWLEEEETGGAAFTFEIPVKPVS